MTTCGMNKISKVSVELTSAAIDYFAGKLAKNKRAVGICFGMERAGCSGFVYVPEVVESPSSEMIKVDVAAPFAVYVVPAVASNLNGLRVDAVQKGLGRVEVVYQNPNEAARCGCGESVKFKS